MDQNRSRNGPEFDSKWTQNKHEMDQKGQKKPELNPKMDTELTQKGQKWNRTGQKSTKQGLELD